MNEEKLLKEATSPQQLEAVEKMIKNDIQNKVAATRPMNRRQRRALQKRMGKKNNKQSNIITETAKKIDYIDLIEKLKALNAKNEKENKENEDSN